jgi:hypothetical protein
MNIAASRLLIVTAEAILLMIMGCKQSAPTQDMESVQVQSERQDKAARLDAYLEHQAGLTAEVRGTEIYITWNVNDSAPTLDEARCLAKQLNLNDGVFDKLRFITLNVEAHTESFRAEFDLPIPQGPLPSDCEIPPGPLY